MAETARRSFIATTVAVAVVAAALALWHLRLLLELIFLAFTIAAAMRPGVESLNRRRVPRGLGITLHYLVLLGLILLLLGLVVPPAVSQVNDAVQNHQIGHAARQSSGLERDVLAAIQRKLDHLPTPSKLIERGATVTFAVVRGFVFALFVLAAAAYWVTERDRAIDLVTSLVPRKHRKTVRDTWHLIDLKLGAFVRGQLILILLVSTILSGGFFAVGEPYWLLIGVFAGVVEIIPVVGPLTAGAVAVGVGLTSSVTVGVLAGVVVFLMRMAQDYVIVPRVLGGATGLPPLLILVAALGTELLLGGASVVLAVPLAAVLVTLVDVIVRDRDPAEEDVPSVLFSPKEE
jgi:predicted PurR-regulated permease PerM